MKCAWTSDATSKENRLPEAGPPWGPLGSKKGHPMVKESCQVTRRDWPLHQEPTGLLQVRLLAKDK